MTQSGRVLQGLLAFGLLAFSSCSPGQGLRFVGASRATASQTVGCSPAKGVSNDPRSIDEAVALINALPKPLSVACFIEALARPIQIQATSSDFSVQPAEGEGRPRIFIVRGNLVMTVVASDKYDAEIELGERVADGRSIKGAIAFPVIGPVNSDGAYSYVRRGSLTTCASCHSPEVPMDSRPGVFVSKILPPMPLFEVSVTSVVDLAANCDPETEPRRCGILRAVVGGGGDVSRADF
jgi:hypothetical protein